MINFQTFECLLLGVQLADCYYEHEHTYIMITVLLLVKYLKEGFRVFSILHLAYLLVHSWRF